jgi:ATP-dependent RNA helicase RhlE
LLDEADQMLDLGFIPRSQAIVPDAPGTEAEPVLLGDHAEDDPRACRQVLTDPAEVAVTPAATTVEKIDQFVTFVTQPEKPALLTMLLRKEKMERVLIFSRTKHGATES